MTLGMGRHRREGTANGLTAGERWALFARSFLLQSVWNTRGMQNVGFAFVLLPLTRRLTAREEVSAFLKRHLRFFNTNPVFASYVVGSVAAAEIRGDANGAVEAKRALAGPLGMAGDSLFWGGLRPLAALLGVALAVTGRYWGALVLLAIYNVPHLAFRFRGIAVGARAGPAGAREVLGPGLRRAVTAARHGTALVAGLVVGLAVGGSGGVEPWRLAVAGAFFVLAFVGVKARVPQTLIGLAAVAGGIVLMLSGAGGGVSWSSVP